MTCVLIVDDDATLRATIGRDLGGRGFVVFLADDADAAAKILTDESVDVMLTDLRMPCADGIDLLDRARTLSPRTRSILMSGFASARDYQRAIEYGAVRVLCKPFTQGELLQSIQLAIDCGTGFRGSIHGLSLIDLLQMFHFGQRSLTIIVDGGETAEISLEAGRIVHAKYRDEVGEPALYAILAMQAGSVRTSVLVPDGPRTITRDFEPLLLDALRTLDENARGPSTSDLVPSASVEDFANRLRTVEGYASAFLVDAQCGAVLATDGEARDFDVQCAATGYAELYQAERAVLAAMVVDDSMESVLITLSRQYHVLYAIPNEPSLFVCAVIERRASNLGFIRMALSRQDERARW